VADPIPASPLLVLKGISKRFGGLRAVSDLDLAVGRGELRCLIGPNGAGKSTVFKLIVGFERPTTGSITFDGEGIDRWPTWKRARQGLSIKMQIPGVYPELTVEDNMRVAAQHHVRGQQMEEAIARLLARVGLNGTGHMLTKNLSWRSAWLSQSTRSCSSSTSRPRGWDRARRRRRAASSNRSTPTA
jgi:ABC-type branched-subunit amino acid transport system ATPase component